MSKIMSKIIETEEQTGISPLEPYEIWLEKRLDAIETKLKVQLEPTRKLIKQLQEEHKHEHQ